MADKSGSKSGSKTNLNESTLPLLEEGQGDVPEKIELETKGENQDQKEESKKGNFKLKLKLKLKLHANLIRSS